MNFYNQYKNLFEITSNVSSSLLQSQITNISQYQRLRIDNQLFIDKPYVPAYSKQYQLSSKLRQLNKDYNEFQSQVKELESLSEIPKRSQSRRKGKGQQSTQLNVQNYPTKLKRLHHQQSTIFSHYEDNSSNTRDLQYKIGTTQKRKLKSDIRQSFIKQNEQHTNTLKQQSSSPLMNDIFNWKTQQFSTIINQQTAVNPTTLSKHKLNTPILQNEEIITYGVKSNILNNNKQYNNKPSSSSDNQNNISVTNKKITALERRKLAKQRIDQRREKLKLLLKIKY